jgi:DNA-binding MarR family transcriptional regulator
VYRVLTKYYDYRTIYPLMLDYEFSLLVKLYLIGKKLQAAAKKHNSDLFSQTIILWLASSCPLTISDIAYKLSIKVSAATSKILEMEQNGFLLRRKTGDRRSHVVELTDKGKKALTAVKKIIANKYKGVTIGLSKEDVMRLESLLHHIKLEEAVYEKKY